MLSVGVESQQAELRASRLASFISYSSEFNALIGYDAKPKLLASRPVTTPFAHEGGIFVPDTNEVWFTANQVPMQNTNVSSVDLDDNDIEQLLIKSPILTPNGLNYFDGSVYICSQGNQTTPGAIYAVNPTTMVSRLVVNSWFGLRLNSPNDVTFSMKIAGRKYMWFTDPPFAYLQGFGSLPQMGSYVYRFDLTTEELRPVITDLMAPNGIALDQDEMTLYVTDTETNSLGKNTYVVYAYDLTNDGLPVNRRVFSVSSLGGPDGIKVDKAGRVWIGEADGINVRDKHGTLLGVILGRNLCQSGVISNFALAGSTVIILAQEQLWRLDLTMSVL
ncbi:unnamed protein product [Rotaria sp. Silwood1]|nr:unnamed protein product [Rotaria sp. Silwood1]